ncbi:PGPGW domain-containing protein [Kocuria sp.]|uniref:PGPGW domain-containing protein n=1 Tax=Kocuria sp. TaxID=1871328 RepID=UPI0026E0FE4D|nr:PGPGW domain-containing protein [Kocuria sp.]MDO5617433.1 PGPGW domain-containing protein [Kocuria sp.]
MNPRGRAAPDPASSELAEELRRGQDRSHPIRRRIEKFQAWSHQGSKFRRVMVRGSIAVIGFVLFIAGVAMLVLPGPGWVFIFLGIGVWSMEFDWAHKLNLWAIKKLSVAWAKIQRTRLMQWWRWCLSGPQERNAANAEGARRQAAGQPVRFSPHNAPPGH